MNQMVVGRLSRPVGKWVTVSAGLVVVAALLFVQLASSTEETADEALQVSSTAWIAFAALLIAGSALQFLSRRQQAALRLAQPGDPADVVGGRLAVGAAADEVIALFGGLVQGEFRMELLDPPDEHRIDAGASFAGVAGQCAYADRRQQKLAEQFVAAVIDHNKQMDFLDRYKTIRGSFRVPKGMDRRLPSQVKNLCALAHRVKALPSS